MNIKELEENLQQVRIYERTDILSFKANTGKVRNELEDAIVDMYTNLHLFQNVVAIDWINVGETILQKDWGTI
jgi:hypothetical protein